jgi:flagellar biosynthetic protein FliQ
MNEADVITVARSAIYTAVMMLLPVMSAAIVIGLIIALFQAVTQIQEITLNFAPKILTVFITLAITAPFMYGQLNTFVDYLMDQIMIGGAYTFN